MKLEVNSDCSLAASRAASPSPKYRKQKNKICKKATKSTENIEVKLNEKREGDEGGRKRRKMKKQLERERARKELGHQDVDMHSLPEMAESKTVEVRKLCEDTPCPSVETNTDVVMAAATDSHPRQSFRYDTPVSYDRSHPTSPKNIQCHPSFKMDVLIVRPMRRLSPRLEDITTITSPPHIKTGTALLGLIKSRAGRLQSQITAFEIQIQKAQKSFSALANSRGTQSGQHLELRTRIEMIEKVLKLLTDNWTEVLVMEYALRDTFDEDETARLDGRLGNIKGELEDMAEACKGRMTELMMEVSPDAARKSTMEVPGES
jgi:hypothetical protein